MKVKEVEMLLDAKLWTFNAIALLQRNQFGSYVELPTRIIQILKYYLPKYDQKLPCPPQKNLK